MIAKTRGIINNNPGNIKFSNVQWQGKVRKDANSDPGRTFEQFQTMEHGIRAMIKNLVTYVDRYNLTSVKDIVDRYAPPGGENDPTAQSNYVTYVMNESGLDQDIRVEDIPTIAWPMIEFENGQNAAAAYVLPFYKKGVEMAGLKLAKDPVKKKSIPVLVLAALGYLSYRLLKR
tara:strand:+ start:666 stop:1187 length:522 start_codon:yes stop_codon:yes gene_type:complete